MAKLLFICDPLEGFKPEKDSTLAMMKAAQARDHSIWVADIHGLSAAWGEGGAAADSLDLRVMARCIRLQSKEPYVKGEWWDVVEEGWSAAAAFDAVVMRTDPPFTTDYLVATQMLETFERAGIPVFNRPRALRDHGEKLAVLEFAQFAPPGLVSANMRLLHDFAHQHHRVVYKPLDAMGGAGIFLSHATDPNLPVILETLTLHGSRQIMVQKWLPEIVEGDKRVLLIDGEVIPFALARIPPTGASRGNLAAGGRPEARPLTVRDQEIAQALAPILADRGLFLVGLDIIGEHLTEINVTSPTGFQEIQLQTGFDVAGRFIERLEQRLQHRVHAA